MFKMIFRRLLKRPLSNIVAPLTNIADELAKLREDNSTDNVLDGKVITKLEEQIYARNIENQQALSTEVKIRELLH